MEMVYIVDFGRISKRELVSETPLGYRVKNKGISGTTVKLRQKQYNASRGGIEFKTSIATLDKNKAIEHAGNQIDDLTRWANKHLDQADELRSEIKEFNK